MEQEVSRWRRSAQFVVQQEQCLHRALSQAIGRGRTTGSTAVDEQNILDGRIVVKMRLGQATTWYHYVDEDSEEAS